MFRTAQRVQSLRTTQQSSELRTSWRHDLSAVGKLNEVLVAISGSATDGSPPVLVAMTTGSARGRSAAAQSPRVQR